MMLKDNLQQDVPRMIYQVDWRGVIIASSEVNLFSEIELRSVMPVFPPRGFETHIPEPNTCLIRNENAREREYQHQYKEKNRDIETNNTPAMSN